MVQKESRMDRRTRTRTARPARRTTSTPEVKSARQAANPRTVTQNGTKCQVEGSGPGGPVVAYLLEHRCRLLRSTARKAGNLAGAEDVLHDAVERALRYPAPPEVAPAAVACRHLSFALRDRHRADVRARRNDGCATDLAGTRIVTPEEVASIADSAFKVIERARQLAAGRASVAAVLAEMTETLLEGREFSSEALAVALRVQPNRVHKLCTEARRLIAQARAEVAAE